jgi:osmoprotectant transport system permease protein
MRTQLIALLVVTFPLDCATDGKSAIVLGSKKFTESFVLTELAKQSLEQAGFNVEHRQGMGGTIILWEALR